MISIIMEFLCLFLRSHFEETSGGIAKMSAVLSGCMFEKWVKMNQSYKSFYVVWPQKMSKNDGNDHKQPDSVLLSCICIHLGCLLFDRKFPKFWMEGKWKGHFSEIPTKNWGVCFEVVLAFIPVGMKQMEFCLTLTNFSVPSRFQTHATRIRLFWIQTVMDVAFLR